VGADKEGEQFNSMKKLQIKLQIPLSQPKKIVLLLNSNEKQNAAFNKIDE
jgi:hypothetical protein